MRVFDKSQAESSQVGEVDVARWEQYRLDGAMPFQAMWYEVPPGQAAPLDQHPERELSLVVTGTATVEASGETVDVGPGGAFLLGGQEAHRVRNRSDRVPLLVFSAYWHPSAASGAPVPPAAAAREPSDG